MRRPKPESVWVVLWSEKLGRPTRHHYAMTEELEVPNDFDRDGRFRTTFVHVFRCSQTGAARVYGCESVPIRPRVRP